MMKPIYRCGYQVPSIFRAIFNLVCFFTIPYLLALIIENLIHTNNLLPDKSIILFIYPFTLLIILSVVHSYHSCNIYLFYNNFMLYKERLTLHDRVALFLAKDELSKLETILMKRNYLNINELKIIIKEFEYMRTNETGIDIEFKLIFNDKTFNLYVKESTKEAYKQFLAPFITYHVNINDPYNLIAGLDQPLRLYDYFKTKT